MTFLYFPWVSVDILYRYIVNLLIYPLLISPNPLSSLLLPNRVSQTNDSLLRRQPLRATTHRSLDVLQALAHDKRLRSWDERPGLERAGKIAFIDDEGERADA